MTGYRWTREGEIMWLKNEHGWTRGQVQITDYVIRTKPQTARKR